LAPLRPQHPEPYHQQPEVNYLPRFSPELISLERYTLSVYRAGRIDHFENLDTVHIRLLVVSPAPRDVAGYNIVALKPPCRQPRGEWLVS